METGNYIEIGTSRLNSPEERGKRLRELRKSLRLTRGDIELKHAIPAATIKNWESGRYGGLSETGARKMLKIFQDEGIQCSFEWLFNGIGEHYQSPRIRIEIPPSEDEAITRELKSFLEHNPGAIDYLVSDDTMAPWFQVGDFVAGIRYFPPFHSLNERIKNMPCIVQAEPGGTLVRLVTPDDNGFYTLSCTNLNASTPILENVKLITVAPIIWLRRKKIRSL